MTLREVSSFRQSPCSVSIKESARMAQSNNFMGLIVQARVLVSGTSKVHASILENFRF